MLVPRSLCMALALLCLLSCFPASALSDASSSSDFVAQAFPDYYAALGLVAEDHSTSPPLSPPAVTKAQVEKAFRSRAIKAHPDKNKSPNAEEQFKLLLDAKETLLDKRVGSQNSQVVEYSRAAYDAKYVLFCAYQRARTEGRKVVFNERFTPPPIKYEEQRAHYAREFSAEWLEQPSLWRYMWILAGVVLNSQAWWKLICWLKGSEQWNMHGSVYPYRSLITWTHFAPLLAQLAVGYFAPTNVEIVLWIAGATNAACEY